MRPRGNPPTPNALSREIEPVEITETGTMASFDPSRTMDPLPNCFSIWPNARSKARVRSRSSMWDCSPGEDYGEFSLYQWRFRRVCLEYVSRHGTNLVAMETLAAIAPEIWRHAADTFGTEERA